MDAKYNFGDRKYRVTVYPLGNTFARWGWEVESTTEGYPWATIACGESFFKNWAIDRCIRAVEEHERDLTHG